LSRTNQLREPEESSTGDSEAEGTHA
jgi:hypothetical protein